MEQRPHISVVICTYNRCDMLRGAMESVLAQDCPREAYEVIVVDNNSSDGTRELVESFIRAGHSNLRYLFEPRQGLSHARNTGIAAALGEIVTFTDDDIRAASDWLSSIRRAFAEHPEVDLIGGKVLPQWNAVPPAWLTVDHWSPLALIDHGEAEVYTTLKRPLSLVGANLSVRRAVLEELGGFRADFQRVKDSIGSTEDHEFQLRLWRSGKQGLYRPDVVVSADVQNDRLSKAYHRRWHTGHGSFCARMRLAPVPPGAATLFGVPSHLYGTWLRGVMHWGYARMRGDAQRAFQCELGVRYATKYIATSYELYQAENRSPLVPSVLSFIVKVSSRKLRSALGRQ